MAKQWIKLDKNNYIPTPDEITNKLGERSCNMEESIVFYEILKNMKGWLKEEGYFALDKNVMDQGLNIYEIEEITHLEIDIIFDALINLLKRALIIMTVNHRGTQGFLFNYIRIASPGQSCNKIEDSDIKELCGLSYHEYLKTDHWKRKRKRKLKQCRYKCQLCASSERLNVHHNTYKNKGRELLSDLIVLCGNCHAKYHDKTKD